MAQDTKNEVTNTSSVDKTAPTTLPHHTTPPKSLRIGKAITPKRYTIRAPRTQLNKPTKPNKVKKSKVHEISWKKESSTLQLAQAPYVKLDKTQFDTLLRTLRRSKRRAKNSKANLNPETDETTLQMALPSRLASEARNEEAIVQSSSESPLKEIAESEEAKTPSSAYTDARETQISPSLFRDGNLSEPDKSSGNTAEESVSDEEVEELAEDFDQSLGIDIVDIYVGPTQRPFRIHKKLLCKRIPFFSKMFNGPFQEARTLTATLPEDDADAFALLVEWVYKGTFNVLDLSDADTAEDHYRKPKFNMAKLVASVRLYDIADKYMLYSLMDCLMSIHLCFWEGRGLQLPLVLIRAIIKESHAPPNSPLRRYLAKWLHYYYLFPEMAPQKFSDGQYTVDELADTVAADPELAKLFMEHLRGNDWALFDEEHKLVQFDYCEFHKHPEEEDKDCLYTRVRIQQPAMKALSAWWEQEDGR